MKKQKAMLEKYQEQQKAVLTKKSLVNKWSILKNHFLSTFSFSFSKKYHFNSDY